MSWITDSFKWLFLILLVVGTSIYITRSCSREEVEQTTNTKQVNPKTPLYLKKYQHITIDSTGKKIRETTDVENVEKSIVVEDSSGQRAEIIISKPRNVTFLPDIRARTGLNVHTVGDSDFQITSINQPQPFVDFHFRPMVGVVYSESLSFSVGATFVRLGPLYLGASINARDNALTASGDVGVRVFENLMLTGGIDTQQRFNIGLKYHF